jgi:hypothetical protein
MAISPRVVTADRHITWDGVVQRLPRGQVLDVPPGSALEREIGPDFLVPLPGSVATQVPAEDASPQEEEPKPAPARPRAKSGSDDKDGGS